MDENTTLPRIYKAEFRYTSNGDGSTTLHALAVPYNKLSEDLGGFREKFLPGSFADSLSADIFCDVEHCREKKLARSRAGSLKLTETRDGLYATITLPSTTLGADTLAEIKGGLLDGLSIVFRDPVEKWEGTGKDRIRTISKATLKGLTLTSFPAYPQTRGTISTSAGAAPRSVGCSPVAVLRKRLDLEQAIEENDAAIRRSRETPVEFLKCKIRQAEAEMLV
jgi:HK97 family phage prohead protease